MSYWTLVQHSGFAYGGKPAFRQAVEVQSIPDAGTLARVGKAGGRLFDRYPDAYNAEETYNYPPENKGLIPSAKGKFKTVRGLDLPLFIPAEAR